MTAHPKNQRREYDQKAFEAYLAEERAKDTQWRRFVVVAVLIGMCAISAAFLVGVAFGAGVVR